MGCGASTPVTVVSQDGSTGTGTEGEQAEMDAAATKMQAVQRGKQARKEKVEMDAAATKMQAVQRGKAARKETAATSAPAAPL